LEGVDMNILVIGGGGREHALIWKIKQSPRVEKVYCAPGNGGISNMAECVNIPADDIGKLVNFAKENNIDLTVVGPEAPLVAGIVDEFEKNNLRCFGPRKKAAEIEGSKVFSKYLMKKYGIPTAEYEEFSNPAEAKEYLKCAQYPIVVKADGLAAGKGVIIANNYDEACEAVHEIMESKIFKDAGNKIIIEEFLDGKEVSVLAFTDGTSIKPMVSSKDHKRIFDNDMGPNTGGMGTISPVSYYTDHMDSFCMEKIFAPTIKAMASEGRIFKGVLYFGLMLTSNGPKVLEYNCRFGDPETQVVLPRLKSDIIEIFEAVIDEKLENVDIEWSEKASCCVIISSGGYPGHYEKGKIIEGLENIPDDVMVFHSGTKLRNGNITTDGGRVLGVTALGDNVEDAAERVYSTIGKIKFDGMHYRKDIGKR